ncbi:UbiD family decarboxylase [Paradesulfitobacterium aromaticivorans]
MSFKDLRDWLEQVEAFGELKTVEGADWNMEIGAVSDLVAKNSADKRCLLFDNVTGYPAGYRVLTNILNSARRLALTLNQNPSPSDREFVETWRQRSKEIVPIKPKVVSTGSVMENIHMGDDVNLWEFPTPLWHDLDGGRYIGTGSVTITRDPDEGWVNLGTYRVMIHDDKTLAFFVSPGKDGRIHRDKYFAQNKPCPVAISFGQDPLLLVTSIMPSPYGVCEYDYAGGIQGRPVEVIEGKVTGLPIPAHAEIVIEGESLPNEAKTEGPFGEWTGYYASHSRPEPLIRVKAIYHRNNPIITGATTAIMPNDFCHAYELMRAAQIWNEIESAGVPDIRGVACHQHRFITVVSIKQRYPGHAKQAAMLAMQCHAGAYLGRYVIVVDEDIDPYNFDEVLWALSTRVDPQRAIEIVKECWSGPLDPVIPVEEKGYNSRALILACKPFPWKDKFPPSIQYSAELKEQVRRKFAGGVF